MTHLLPNFNNQHEDEILFKSKAVKISTNVKSKHFFSIHQWTTAFDIFMSLFIVKSPESSLGLIKYAYNIRAMSKQFGFTMAKSYDENVRKLRKMMMFDWSIINEDLWRSAFYHNVKLPTIQVLSLKKTKTNLIQTPPFKSGPSNTKINSPPDTAGPTEEQGLAKTSQIVNSNTSVSNVAKGMPLHMQRMAAKQSYLHQNK